MVTIELVTGTTVEVDGGNVHTNDLDWVAHLLFDEVHRTNTAPAFTTEEGGRVYVNPDHVVRVYETGEQKAVLDVAV